MFIIQEEGVEQAAQLWVLEELEVEEMEEE